MGQGGSRAYSMVPEDRGEFLLHPLTDSEEEEEDLFVVTPAPAAEGWATTTLQIGLPFLVAGLGMVAAGLVLDLVQHWPVFLEVKELFILVPALLGLKVTSAQCAVHTAARSQSTVQLGASAQCS